jgi:hypothetical protein
MDGIKTVQVYLIRNNCKREESIVPVQMYIWHQFQLAFCRRHVLITSERQIFF